MPIRTSGWSSARTIRSLSMWKKGSDSAGLSYYRAFCINRQTWTRNFRSSCISLAASWRAFRFALSRLS